MKSYNALRTMVIAVLLGTVGVQAQTSNVGVNNNGAAPDASAILDISSNYVGTQKGFLIPKMTDAQRLAIAPVQGLTVYQTTAPAGFYYYNGATASWVLITRGNGGWGITGDAGTNPTTNWVGTNDNQSLVIRTNNVEAVRLDTDGDLGINVPNPQEKLDVAGAIKLTGTSATNNVGTIRWNAAGYHEGNVNGTPTGWLKLQNDYVEVSGQAYVQPGPVTCNNTGTATSDIGPVNAPSSQNYLVTPYDNNNALSRHQYLFRANELNVQLNQTYLDPNATQGICPGQRIRKIAFYVEPPSAGVAAQVNWYYSVTIKHTSQTALATFDNTADPAGKCICTNIGGTAPCSAFGLQPQVVVGWSEFDFSADPFIWDGVSNIIIDIGRQRVGAYGGNNHFNIRKTNLTWNGTYTRAGAAGCSTPGGCGATLGAGIGAGCPAGGPSNQRPVIRFTGDMTTAPPAGAGVGAYMNYNGGFMVESTPNWTTQTVPYYSFKGPGSISAENGVYDDQIRLNDHVFDRHFDGRVDPRDAKDFGTMRNLSVDEMVNYVERERHLPTMKGRSDWNVNGGFGLGDLTNQLWTTAETQALYLSQLNARIDALEVLASDRRISTAEYNAVRQRLTTMEGLTDAQRTALLRDCASRVESKGDPR